VALPPPPRPPPRPGALAQSGPPTGEDAIAKSRREKDELEKEAQAVEEEAEALKARYEQYFLGVERKEPVRQREELKKRVLRLKGAFTRNAGLRFKIQSLHARFISYERLWLRSAREKEEGTYHRDVFKARLHARKAERAAAAPGGSPAPQQAPSPPRSGGEGRGEGAAATPVPTIATATPVPTRTPPPAQKPSATPPPPGAMADSQMRALYDAYIAAKRRCNEDVSRLSYDAVAKTVSKQVPELMTRFKAKSVEFKVEVKDGKAVLKAIPKV
jgi:hypothetical protein